MVKIEGLTKLIQQFGNKLDKARRDSGLSVIVGYTANYALIVHERIPGKKGPKRKKTKRKRAEDVGKKKGKGQQVRSQVGQPKFLEEPARTKAAEIGRVVATVTKATGSLEMGLIVGGQRLQRESQKLVPVVTGNLQGSAFTRVDR